MIVFIDRCGDLDSYLCFVGFWFGVYSLFKSNKVEDLKMGAIVKYDAAVRVEAGWRTVIVEAEIESVSLKRSRVVRVISVDGNLGGYASRTGAKRQTYSVDAIFKREIGVVKNNSSLDFGDDL